jgi:hypothetical protein
LRSSRLRVNNTFAPNCRCARSMDASRVGADIDTSSYNSRAHVSAF